MSKRLTTEDFIHRARSVHGDKYDYSQSVYTGKDKSIVIICPIHGKFLQTPNNHWKGKGCATCSGNKKYSTSDFIAKSRSVHGHTYQYDHVHYVNVDTPVSITCPIHGDFEQTPANICPDVAVHCVVSIR